MGSELERLARAACVAGNLDPSMSNSDGIQNWNLLTPIVRAILTELMEPSEGMLSAAKPEPSHLYGKDGRGEEYMAQMKIAVQVDRMAVASEFRAMIQHILSDGEGE